MRFFFFVCLFFISFSVRAYTVQTEEMSWHDCEAYAVASRGSAVCSAGYMTVFAYRASDGAFAARFNYSIPCSSGTSYQSALHACGVQCPNGSYQTSQSACPSLQCADGTTTTNASCVTSCPSPSSSTLNGVTTFVDYSLPSDPTRTACDEHSLSCGGDGVTVNTETRSCSSVCKDGSTDTISLSDPHGMCQAQNEAYDLGQARNAAASSAVAASASSSAAAAVHAKGNQPSAAPAAGASATQSLASAKSAESSATAARASAAAAPSSSAASDAANVSLSSFNDAKAAASQSANAYAQAASSGGAMDVANTDAANAAAQAQAAADAAANATTAAEAQAAATQAAAAASAAAAAQAAVQAASDAIAAANDLAYSYAQQSAASAAAAKTAADAAKAASDYALAHPGNNHVDPGSGDYLCQDGTHAPSALACDHPDCTQSGLVNAYYDFASNTCMSNPICVLPKVLVGHDCLLDSANCPYGPTLDLSACATQPDGGSGSGSGTVGAGTGANGRITVNVELPGVATEATLQAVKSAIDGVKTALEQGVACPKGQILKLGTCTDNGSVPALAVFHPGSFPDISDKLQAAKDQFQYTMDSIRSEAKTYFNLSLSGSGGSLPVLSFGNVWGVSLTFDLAQYSTQLSVVGLSILFAAYVMAAMIVMGK